MTDDELRENFRNLLGQVQALETLVIFDITERLAAKPDPGQSVRRLFLNAQTHLGRIDHAMPSPERQEPVERELVRQQEFASQHLAFLEGLIRDAVVTWRPEP